jgi:hypothetical protein
MTTFIPSNWDRGTPPSTLDFEESMVKTGAAAAAVAAEVLISVRRFI